MKKAPSPGRDPEGAPLETEGGVLEWTVEQPTKTISTSYPPSLETEGGVRGGSLPPIERQHRYRHTFSERDERARQLRKEMTPAEKVLWQALRRKQVDGLRFRRQVALGPYILDFICSEKRLIVEVDGDIHDEQIDYDAARTEHLEQYGYRVLRFRNGDVLRDLNRVLLAIREAALIPGPSPNPGGRE